jgi:hypothetical protein
VVKDRQMTGWVRRVPMVASVVAPEPASAAVVHPTSEPSCASRAPANPTAR